MPKFRVLLAQGVLLCLSLSCSKRVNSNGKNCFPPILKHKINYENRYKRKIYRSAISSDGKYFFTIEKQGLGVFIWDSNYGEVINIIKVGEFISQIKVVNNKWIALLTYPINDSRKDHFRGVNPAGGTNLRFYDFDGNPVAKSIQPLQLDKTQNYIKDYLISRNGDNVYIIFNQPDTKIQKWDLRKNQMLFEFEKRSGTQESIRNRDITLNNGAQILLKGPSKRGFVTIWNTQTGQIQGELNLGKISNPFVRIYSHTAKSTFVVTSGLSIEIWDIFKKRKIWEKTINQNSTFPSKLVQEPRISNVFFIETRKSILIQTTDEQLLILSEKDGQIIYEAHAKWTNTGNSQCKSNIDCQGNHCINSNCWKRTSSFANMPFSSDSLLINSNGDSMLSQSPTQFLRIWLCE